MAPIISFPIGFVIFWLLPEAAVKGVKGVRPYFHGGVWMNPLFEKPG